MTPFIKETVERLKAAVQFINEPVPDGRGGMRPKWPEEIENVGLSEMIEAADTIERLAGALEPFAELADEIEALASKAVPPYNTPDTWAKSCGWDDLLAARRALSGEPT